ncbi:MAG: nucleotide exchange factor GrpE [Gammaproteobacteria bacterium]|nr:nucleotide exchange factor GrpE [Gammaproteobacteria bacterium]
MTDTKEQAGQEAEVENEQDKVEAFAEDSIEALQDALEQAQAKAEENWNIALRAKADAENVTRRADKDVANARKFALERFVNELVPVIDSMELGLAAAMADDADLNKIREGTELTLKMFTSAVEKFGVEQVNPEGEKFNPEFHQAMTMQEAADAEPNTVLTVIQKGYTLQGRLVRPAMVVVSKAAVPPAESKTIDETA